LHDDQVRQKGMPNPMPFGLTARCGNLVATPNFTYRFGSIEYFRCQIDIFRAENEQAFLLR